VEIERLRADGWSFQKIGWHLGRAASTVSREVKRNSARTKAWPGGYDGIRADGLAARRRRWDGRFKLARQPALRAVVRDGLAMGWSPEQIAGRLARLEGRTVISHETIYRYVYHRSAQKDYWHRLLPRRQWRRGRLKRGGVSPVDHIRDRRTLHERPAEASDRQTPGHWEADLMLFSTHGQVLLAVHERASRLMLVSRQPGKAAAPVADRLISGLMPLPQALRQTITFDNGTEFAHHWRLAETIGLQTFFCEPHKPWQKGGIENAIGRLRRAFPRKTNLATLSQNDIHLHVAAYNNTPRKCLDFKTPAEVFLNFLQPLHFICESTPSPARG